MGTYRASSKQRYTIFRDNDLGTIAPGGDVLQFTAAATLKLGDIVYLSAALTVNKSASAANHDKIIGVVVGGQALGDFAINDDAALVGTTAATVNQTVLVLTRGVAYVTTAAAIAAGVSLVADTATSGRVKAATLFAVTAPTAGTLAVSAPTKGTLAVAVDVTPVTSSAANGDILTGAPGGGVLSGAPAGGVLSGEGVSRIIGKMLQASTGAAEVKLAWINC